MENNKFHLSYSRMLVFKTCPGQYYDKYVLKNPTPDYKWPATVFGDSLHKVLEHIIQWIKDDIPYKQVSKELDVKFLECFKGFQEQYQKEKKWKVSRDYDEKRMLKSGVDFSFNLYDLIRSYYSGYNIESEQEYSSDYKNKGIDVDLNGRIDIQIIKEQIVGVGDLKTTKDPHQYFFVDWEHCIQKLTYEYMIYKKYGIIPKLFQYVVCNHNNKTIFVKDFSNGKIDSIDEHFSYLFSLFHEVALIHEADNPDMYKPEKDRCHWCWRSKTCPRKYMSPVTQKLKATMDKNNKLKEKLKR